MFLSTYENKLDKKGRVSVPASFRSYLSNLGYNVCNLGYNQFKPTLLGYNLAEPLGGAARLYPRHDASDCPSNSNCQPPAASSGVSVFCSASPGSVVAAPIAQPIPPSKWR